MRDQLPIVTPKQTARIAQRLGFEFRRQRGSHVIYVRASDKARVVIPMHSADLKISVEEFRLML